MASEARPHRARPIESLLIMRASIIVALMGIMPTTVADALLHAVELGATKNGRRHAGRFVGVGDAGLV
jgi:hypothetical protein